MQPNLETTGQPSPANETIVAVSTPPGRGGIGIVRLSGPRALGIASLLVTPLNPLAHAQARFAEIPDPETGKKLDEAVVTLFAGPNSYTGEDLVEIAAHGSPVILDALVRAALQHGARLARPGEFTERAFLSGRIDLTQAEAVRDLIESQTLYQARVAAGQMGGALSRRVKPVKQRLVDLIVLLEAGIDFAEDDIDVTPDVEITSRICAVREPLEVLERSFAHGRIVRSGLTLAIVGRPNVGKSSLFNRLVERERAIVTATPGTTRDLVTETVSLGGLPVQLVDTAGLRDADNEAEAIGVQKSREALAEADAALMVVEANAPLRTDETALIASLADRRAILVRNKCDLGAAESPKIALPTANTSALTGEGVEPLKAMLLEMVRNPAGEAETGMLTNLRHHETVKGALDALAQASKAVDEKIPHEMILIDLHNALKQLDSLTGETTADDILNRIFSTFCIGK